MRVTKPERPKLIRILNDTGIAMTNRLTRIATKGVFEATGTHAFKFEHDYVCMLGFIHQWSPVLCRGSTLGLQLAHPPA